MKSAEEIVTKSKQKNPDLDKVKIAIKLMKRNSNRSLHFTHMFREMTIGVHSIESEIKPVVETKTVSISQAEQTKAKSLFSKNLKL